MYDSPFLFAFDYAVFFVAGYFLFGGIYRLCIQRKMSEEEVTLFMWSAAVIWLAVFSLLLAATHA